MKSTRALRPLTLAAAGLLAFATQASAQVQTWRCLMIIKPVTKVSSTQFGTCNATMTQDEIQSAQRAFDYATNWIYDISGKKVTWQTEVRISDLPLTTVTAIGDKNDECYPAPLDVQRDLAKYAPSGKFDSVFIYWKPKGDRTLPQPHNWGRGPSRESLNMGYSTIGCFPPSSLTKDTSATETWVHEWLHQVEQFYQAKGIKLPKDVGIHAAEDCGYKQDVPNSFCWKNWYRDFMAGTIKGYPGTGLGAAAWAKGTMRTEAARLNLLVNSDGASGNSGWRFDSWRQGAKPTNDMLDRSVLTPDGKPSFHLKNRTDYDDARWVQTVSVKPNTNYVLGGYVRTKGVSANPTSGRYGANLCVLGSQTEVTDPGQFNVYDWQYVSTVIPSGQRSSLDIALRNGFYSSTTTGDVWIGQPTLIEAPGTGGMPGGKYNLLDVSTKTAISDTPATK
jgi:hypothetical protein